jgi:cyclopropane-fatty-acyl-phospholipid synthase
MRLLDVGRGWGGMVITRRAHYQVRVLGVTLSEQQAAGAACDWEAALRTAEVGHMDYRGHRDRFDAISSTGSPDIGKAQLAYLLRLPVWQAQPGGRLLNHCITRPDNHGPARVTDGFIYRYVFLMASWRTWPPDLADARRFYRGQARENLREHYALTLAAWCANLDKHWDEAVAEVGESTARVWRLYMAGSRLGFERNQIQLHQVLGVKLGDRGESGMPLRPDWEPPGN